MSGKIVKLLGDVAAARATLAAAEAAIPADLWAAVKSAGVAVRNAEAAAKDAAKYIPPQNQHTLIGDTLQLVWTSGRTSWDTPTLEELAEEFPRILDARKEGDGYWAIRARGKVK